jgi:hypothetical protein
MHVVVVVEEEKQRLSVLFNKILQHFFSTNFIENFLGNMLLPLLESYQLMKTEHL